MTWAAAWAVAKKVPGWVWLALGLALSLGVANHYRRKAKEATALAERATEVRAIERTHTKSTAKLDATAEAQLVIVRAEHKAAQEKARAEAIQPGESVADAINRLKDDGAL